jgi:hypothetical protein
MVMVHNLFLNTLETIHDVFQVSIERFTGFFTPDITDKPFNVLLHIPSLGVVWLIEPIATGISHSLSLSLKVIVITHTMYDIRTLPLLQMS